MNNTVFCTEAGKLHKFAMAGNFALFIIYILPELKSFTFLMSGSSPFFLYVLSFILNLFLR